MYQATTVMKAKDVFEGSSGGHRVTMDTGSPEKQGQSPMELLLSAVSGCASVDVVEIMTKKRRVVEGLQVETSADRRDEPWPRIFTKIQLHFILTSPDAKDKELQQAVALSMDKYCSVAGMLREAATVAYSCEVKRP